MPQNESKPTLLKYISVTVFSGTVAVFGIYEFSNRSFGLRFPMLAMTVIFGALFVVLVGAPLLEWLLKAMKFMPVQCAVARIEEREQPALRFLSSPFRVMGYFVIGFVLIAVSLVILLNGNGMTPGSISSNYVNGRLLIFGAAGVFSVGYGIYDLLRWTSGVSLTPEGILWALPFAAPAFIPWDRLECVEFTQDFGETDTKRPPKLLLALRVNEHTNRVQADRLTQHTTLFQHNRGISGYDLVLPANVLLSKPAVVLGTIDRYRNDVRRRPFLGSPEELVDLKAYFKSLPASQP